MPMLRRQDEIAKLAALQHRLLRSLGQAAECGKRGRVQRLMLRDDGRAAVTPIFFKISGASRLDSSSRENSQ